jgi:hypothetical protein
MTRLTTAQKLGLTNMNRNAQLGTLGTRIDNLEYGGMTTPAAGTLSPANIIKYDSAPVAESNTYCMAATALTAVAQTITTGITQPDVPRVLLIKGNAGGIGGNVIITGTDAAGAAITDTIALNGNAVVDGVKAFASIVSIQLPVQTHAGTDTVSIGVDAILGFTCALPATALLLGAYWDLAHGGGADGGSATAAITVSGSLYTAGNVASFNGVLKLTLYYVAAR